MALVALQHRLDNALRDLEHERDLRTRLEADLDREREARTRLEADLARLNDAHHDALVQLNREHWRDICGRIDRVLGANAQISNLLTDLQRVAKREKGTTAPSRPLEHYYLLTEFNSGWQSKSIRCTSGQKQYCNGQRNELILDGRQPLCLCKSGNWIDLRQYVKIHTNKHIEASLDPEYRPLRCDLYPHCTAMWWIWRPGTNITYLEFLGFIEEAIRAFNELSPLLSANDWSRLVLEERIDDEIADLIRDDDEKERDI